VTTSFEIDVFLEATFFDLFFDPAFLDLDFDVACFAAVVVVVGLAVFLFMVII